VRIPNVRRQPTLNIEQDLTTLYLSLYLLTANGSAKFRVGG
jgi:hypothetical protein